MANSNYPTQRRGAAEKRIRFSLCVSAPLRFAVLVQLVSAPLTAQTDSTPLITWEDILPARRGAVLWVRNPTADTVWVDSLHVEKCMNIRRAACGSRAVGIALPPGASKELHRLEPAVPNDAFGYQWFLDWKTARMDSARPRTRRPERDSSEIIKS
jgi:hypothetical protein